MTDCCDKCRDVDFEKTWPEHTAHQVCTNRACECHAPHQNEAEWDGVSQLLKAISAYSEIEARVLISGAPPEWLGQIKDALVQTLFRHFVPKSQIAEVVEQVEREVKCGCTNPYCDKDEGAHSALEALKAKLINPNNEAKSPWWPRRGPSTTH